MNEYWIIRPYEQTAMSCALVEGKYMPSKLFTSGDMLESNSLAGLKLDREHFFGDLD